MAEHDPIAIIGMACRFAGAADLAAYWNNILDQVDAVGAPLPAWEAGRYLDPARPPHLRAATAAGGFLNDLYRFEPTAWGIMPNTLDGGEPDQFLALQVAAEALADGGYLGADHDHGRTGIILGHSTYLHRGQGTLIQHTIVLDQTIELLAALHPQAGPAALDEVRRLLAERLPPFSPDTAPGLVPNVMTGRIANRLNLMGTNYLIDAACASSLLAVGAAMEELRAGRADLMLAGGVNASLPAEVSVIFSQLGALSPSGRIRPFAAGADGTLLGEGLGVVLLKRLDDALRDGDRVYAVVRAVASASDGRGQGLLAPRLEGEELALRRALEAAGVAAEGIGLIEAHGTGIPLGDRTEVTALNRVYGERDGALPRVALGSVKSMISHCIPAAGVAALIKTALALHHKVLPPTLCEAVNPELPLAHSRLYLNTRTRPWIHPADRPRRAGVNAFGFGGINSHAILEEAAREAPGAARRAHWELVLLAGVDRAALLARLRALAERLEREPGLRLGDVAYTQFAQGLHGDFRLAVVADTPRTLARRLRQAEQRIGADVAHWASRDGAAFAAAPTAGKLVFLFPGEGAQYPGMLAELAIDWPAVRAWFDLWEQLYAPRRALRPSELLYPPPTGVDGARRAELEQALHRMDFGSEAVFMASQALFTLLGEFGVRPDAMVGHSTGENSALAAAGAFAYGSRLELGQQVLALNRAYQELAAAGAIATGALLTVGAVDPQALAAVVQAGAGELHLAMDNCPNQVVLFGPEPAIAAAEAALTAGGALVGRLPFDRAYHTPLFANVSEAFAAFYRGAGLSNPQWPLYSCATAAPFPEGSAAVQQLAAAQWSRPVRFTDTVRRLHDDGYRLFLEVGPSGNLSAFVEDILKDRPCAAIPTNLRHKDDRRQFLLALGLLFVHGRPWEVARLFQGRDLRRLDAPAPPPRRPAVALANTMPIVHLDAAARERLRALLVSAPAAAADDGAGAPLDAAADDDPAVHAHFALMRQFLATQGKVMERFLGGPAAGGPLFARVERPAAGELTADCHLSLDHTFLRHHILSGPVAPAGSRLTGLAVVPFTVTLALMAAAARPLADGGGLTAIAAVRAYDWLGLDAGHLALRLHALRADAGRVHVVAQVDGRVAMEGDFLFAVAPAAEAFRPLPPLREPRPARWLPDELYCHGMFHGPLFRSVRRVVAVDGTGIDAELNPAGIDGFITPGETPDLPFNPVILDAVGQVSAYWLSERFATDFNCFPSRVERIEFSEPLPAPQPGLRLRGRCAQGLDAAHDLYRWDYECLRADGAPLLRVHGWQDRFFPVEHRYYQARRSPLEGWLGEALPLPPAGGRPIVAWWVRPFRPGFLDESAGIFRRILAHAQLAEAERDEWAGLADQPRRRDDWLLGRIAAKEAVRRAWLERTGEALFPSEVAIFADGRGVPHADIGLEDGPLALSITHAGGHAAAAVALDGAPVGIDLEVLGRVDVDALAGAFTPEENAVIDRGDPAGRAERALRLWCAKEAAAKYLGSGLDGRPQAFVLRESAGPLLESCVIGYGAEAVVVMTRRVGEVVVGLAFDSG